MVSIAQLLRSEKSNSNILLEFVTVFGGSIFLALMAQFAIPLWFTPVPVTLQTLGVMLLGALLGSKKGAWAVLLYICEGVLGFPVFAGGSAGSGVLFGPTGGYLLGFVLSAYLVGFLLEKGWQKNYGLTLAALALSSLMTLIVGAFWLCFFVGGNNALALGVYPFLIGCGIKVIAASAMIPSARNVLR
jgi:biotin transport system substrate-specific component